MGKHQGPCNPLRVAKLRLVQLCFRTQDRLKRTLILIRQYKIHANFSKCCIFLSNNLTDNIDVSLCVTCPLFEEGAGFTLKICMFCIVWRKHFFLNLFCVLILFQIVFIYLFILWVYIYILFRTCHLCVDHPRCCFNCPVLKSAALFILRVY